MMKLVVNVRKYLYTTSIRKHPMSSNWWQIFADTHTFCNYFQKIFCKINVFNGILLKNDWNWISLNWMIQGWLMLWDSYLDWDGLMRISLWIPEKNSNIARSSMVLSEPENMHCIQCSMTTLTLTNQKPRKNVHTTDGQTTNRKVTYCSPRKKGGKYVRNQWLTKSSILFVKYLWLQKYLRNGSVLKTYQLIS